MINDSISQSLIKEFSQRKNHFVFPILNTSFFFKYLISPKNNTSPPLQRYITSWNSFRYFRFLFRSPDSYRFFFLFYCIDTSQSVFNLSFFPRALVCGARGETLFLGETGKSCKLVFSITVNLVRNEFGMKLKSLTEPDQYKIVVRAVHPIHWPPTPSNLVPISFFSLFLPLHSAIRKMDGHYFQIQFKFIISHRRNQLYFLLYFRIKWIIMIDFIISFSPKKKTIKNIYIYVTEDFVKL